MDIHNEFNRLLNRQLRRSYGEAVPDDEKFREFLAQVSSAYKHFEDDRALLERTMELNSSELNQANEKLRREAYSQRVLLSMLQEAIAVLEDEKPGLPAESTKEVLDPDELVKKAGMLRRIAERQKKTETLLRQQEARMEEAQRLANFGNWSYDFKSNVTFWSAQMFVIFQRDPARGPMNQSEFLECVHPDDKPLVDEATYKLKTSETTSFQHRVILENGAIRWVDVNTKVLRSPETGKAHGLLGTVIDITQRKHAEQTLAAKMTELVDTTSFLDTLIDNLPVMLVVKEAASLRYVSFNKKGLEMTGYTREQVIGKNAVDLFPEEQARIYNRQDMEVLISGQMVAERDEPLTSPNGEQRLLHTRKIPIYDSSGQIKYLMTISEDITEQRLAEEKMRAAAKAADEANRAKSAFLSSMSHELRTPLNAIIGFAQILQRDPNIPIQQRSYVETMYRSGSHLLDMINDVLDLSKIEAGRFELVMEPLNLFDILRDVEGIFMLRAKEKNLRLSIAAAPEVPPQAIGDAKRISQILINLIGNAIKFTDSGSVEVRVSARPIPNTSSMMVKFEVIDSGRGIPHDQIASIFEPFRQVQGFYNEGTGLGLAISSRLVSILDGSMDVESEIGKGSRFWFEVPLESASETMYEEAEPYDPVTGIEGGRKWRIMVVDDIPSNRAVVKALLEVVGFEVIEATNGRDAVEMAEIFRPDVIFMDIMMPVMDGQEATNRIRLYNWGANIKIIALTASGSSDRRKELVQNGFDDYIPKPFREQWIFSSLEKIGGIRFTRESVTPVSAPAESEFSIENLLSFVETFPKPEQNELIEAIEMLDFQSVLKVIKPFLNRDSRAREIARNATSQNNLFFLNLSDRLVT